MEFEKQLSAQTCNIPGVLIFDLSVHGDSRGWFKENWQREKMCALGLPDMGPVQNNISFNDQKGVTRGIHAEPWDKFISVATGSVFGAWVDLRPGANFGEVFTTTLDPSKAIYIPRGVGNSYQALADNTAYTYLVNAHWSAELKKTYTFVNLADPTLGIDWPIPLSECELSEADKNHPMLADAIPMTPRRTLVTGANGQLGSAVKAKAEELGLIDSFDFCDIDTFDMSKPVDYTKYDWSLYGTVINCGAYTAVDKAETEEGRKIAWAANAVGPALLAQTCNEHGITLVHISSDYVFDGTQDNHAEDEAFSPLCVYGQSKAAGDIAVSSCKKHYILRTSWVIGEGHNFVKTMKSLSDRVAAGELPQVTVVNDQFGRPTFTRDLADAIFYLLRHSERSEESQCSSVASQNDATSAPYGTYNITNSGPVVSWHDIASTVFKFANHNADKCIPVSTDDYYANATSPIAPRPAHSVLDLSKLEASGFEPPSWESHLSDYLKNF